MSNFKNPLHKNIWILTGNLMLVNTQYKKTMKELLSALQKFFSQKQGSSKYRLQNELTTLITITEKKCYTLSEAD